MFKLIAISTAGLLCFNAFNALAEPEIKGTPSDLAAYLRGIPKTTSISGEAELRVPAQRAVVTLKVVTESKSLQESLRNNQELRTRISEQLRKRDIPADRIQGSKFSSTPKYGMFGDKAKSYRLENSLRVTVQDEKEFHVVAGLVDQLSEVQFGGVEHEYADKEALKIKALERACENALAKKKLYEEQLGVQLTAISFHPGEIVALNETRRYGLTRFGSAGYMDNMNPSSPAADLPAADGADSALGELIYTAQIVVEFGVQPK